MTLATTAAMTMTLPTIDVPYLILPSMFVRHCAARVCAKQGMEKPRISLCLWHMAYLAETVASSYVPEAEKTEALI